jgi:hypothetical protein
MPQKRHSLILEIITMLAIKLTLLYSLWWLCFSHPIDKTLKADNISAHLFESAQEIRK